MPASFLKHYQFLFVCTTNHKAKKKQLYKMKVSLNFQLEIFKTFKINYFFILFQFLICLTLFVAAAQAGVLAPLSTYSAVAPAYSTYTAAAPVYTTYAAAAPAYTAYAAAPAYTAYPASAYTAYPAPATAYAPSVYSADPVAYTSPVAAYSTLLKK